MQPGGPASRFGPLVADQQSVNRTQPTRIYHSGRILRAGTPLLASLVTAVSAVGIQSVIPMRGPWVPVVAAAGGVAIAALLLLWRNVTRCHLELFDGWFRYVVPSRTFIAHWEDVLEVRSSNAKRRRFLGRHEYTLILGGGSSLRFGSQIGADAALGDEIEARTRSVIAARAGARIAAGRPVEFGPITVTADGIEVKSIGTRSIPFDRVKDHKLRGRHYLIRSLDGHRTTAVPVSRIPSAGALHDLVQRGMEVAREARRPAAARS